jgi:hypothetical protein
MRSRISLSYLGCAVALCFLALANQAVAAPAAPSNFSVSTDQSSCAFELTWTQPSASPADHFKLVFSSNLNPPQTYTIATLKDLSSALTGGGSFTYLDTNTWNAANGLGSVYTDPNSTRYSYTLSSCDSANSCAAVTLPQGTTAPFRTNPLATPGMPTNLAAIGTSTARIAITFTPDASVSPKFLAYGGYTVDRSGGSAFTRVSVPASGKSGLLTYLDNASVSNAVVYTYTIHLYESDEFCLPATRTSNRVLSSSPVTVKVPKSPNATFAATYSKTSGGVNLTWSDSNTAADRTSFLIFRNTENVFTNNETGNLTTFRINDPSATSFIDAPESASNQTGVNANTAYYYQIRTCYTDPTTGAEGCSLPRAASTYTAASPFGNVRAAVLYSSSTGRFADVLITWQDFSSGRSAVAVYRYLGSAATLLTPNCTDGECRDKNVPWDATEYVYTVGDASDLKSSTTLHVNLNIQKVLAGTLWAMADGASTAEQSHGIGWVDVNSDDLAVRGIDFDPAARFSVQVDSAGLMSGNGWASVDSQNHGYGWLMFNNGNLAGCPTAPCEARLDPSTGAMSGWAKFQSADTNESPRTTYDGWVRLSESAAPAFGIVFNQTTESLTGQAWGADVIGWANSFMTLAGVGGTPTELECPTSIATVPAQVTQTQIGLQWTNPDAYDSLSVSRTRYGETARATLRTTTAPQTMPTSITDTGLDAGTRYVYTFDGTKDELSCSSNFEAETLPVSTYDYSFSCVPGTNLVSLAWSGGLSAPHRVELFDMTDAVSEADWDRLTTVVSGTNDPFSANGTYTHSGLQSGKAYTYLLRATYTSGSLNGQTVNYGPRSCTVLGTLTDDAPLLNANGNQTQSSIHLTWKDNAYFVHNWELQWVKLTPEKPTNLAAASQGSTQTTLTWTNTTNSRTDKGPFYHVWERSSAANVNAAFLPSDSTVLSRTFEVAADRGVGGTQTSYTVNDTAVTAGMRYFYRVKACSYATVDLVHHVPDETITPTTVVCSDYDRPGNYTQVTVGASATRARTPWSVVRDAVASAIDAVRSFFSANPGPVEEASAQYGGTVNLNDFFIRNSRALQFSTDASTYLHTGLAASSTYLYRIRATYSSIPKVYADAGRTEPNSAWSNAAAGSTYPDGSCTSQDVPIKICSRNSYCSASTGKRITCTDGSVYPPVSECSVNSDCRNVGTSRTSFEEIRP